jgi:hypothetical protein
MKHAAPLLCCTSQGVADQSCQPGATLQLKQPFIIKAIFTQAGLPSVVAVSNYAWCATRSQQLVAAQVVSDGIDTKSHAKLFPVGSKDGAQLMLLNAQTISMAGGRFRVADETGGLTQLARA